MRGVMGDRAWGWSRGSPPENRGREDIPEECHEGRDLMLRENSPVERYTKLQAERTAGVSPVGREVMG